MNQLILIYSIPIIVLAALAMNWFFRGRDPEKRKNIPLQFAAPKGITPAEAGTLIDESADIHDVVATFFDLAQRRHFVIEDSGNDFQFKLLQDYEDDPGLEHHEKALLKAAFSRDSSPRKLAIIKEKLKENFGFIQEELYEAAFHRGFFERNPKRGRFAYELLGIIFFLISFGFIDIWFFISKQTEFVHLFASSMFISLLFIIASSIMSKKTEKGMQLYEYIFGLRKFLKNPNQKPVGYAEELVSFTKLLPYAIIFDTVQEWISVHKSMLEEKIPDFWKTNLQKTDFAERLQVLIKQLL